MYISSRVAPLPFKIRVSGPLLFKPAVGNAFYLLHPFRLCDRATETAEHMDVVLHPADDERRTFQRFGNAAKLLMKVVADGLVAQEWAAFFGGENEMDVNGGQGLRHSSG